jgi:hypothetical protein
MVFMMSFYSNQNVESTNHSIKIEASSSKGSFKILNDTGSKLQIHTGSAS